MNIQEFLQDIGVNIDNFENNSNTRYLIQQIIFLLEYLYEVRLPYRFNLTMYGPYSQDLYDDLHNPRFNYNIDSDAKEYAEKILYQVNNQKETDKKIFIQTLSTIVYLNKIGGYSGYNLRVKFKKEMPNISINWYDIAIKKL